MRSDILGFNGPIKQKGGLYFYDDPRYSIMSIGITDAVLIERIIKMLLDIRKEVKHPEIEKILEKLKGISPETFVQKIALEEKSYQVFRENTLDINKAAPEIKIRIPRKIVVKPKPAAAETPLEQGFGPLFSFSLSPFPFPSLLWGDLLDAVIYK